MRWHTEETISS